MKKRKRRSARNERSLADVFVATSLAFTLGTLWFLYRILEVRDWLALGGLALLAGLGLAALLGVIVFALRRLHARPPAIVAAVNIFGGILCIVVYLLAAWFARTSWSYGDLLAFGLFLVLFGLLVLVFGRLRLLERFPL